ncbi:YceK/YidQ family lipoprotein [Stutzerimonas zhaodongensis]|uniref:YceK/YidQ family lipoprotein n=1 Tax=Stutzerimonas zhaodongensis TaxID=1176257 RepID=UPI0039F077C2
MKASVVWIVAASLTGCGTIKTLTDEDSAADDLARWESNCSVVPRIYSGAAYQFCNLDSPPRLKNVPAWDKQPPESYLLDLGLSAVADTLVLPYTAYQQVARGSIAVRRSKK